MWYVRTCRRFFQNQQIPPESIPFRFDFTISIICSRLHFDGSSPLALKSWEIRQSLHETKGSTSSGPDTAVIFHPYATVALAPSLVASIIFQQFVGNSPRKLSGWMALDRDYHLGKLYALAFLRVYYNSTILNHTHFPHVTACETQIARLGTMNPPKGLPSPKEEAGILWSFHPQSNRKYGIKMEWRAWTFIKRTNMMKENMFQLINLQPANLYLHGISIVLSSCFLLQTGEMCFKKNGLPHNCCFYQSLCFVDVSTVCCSYTTNCYHRSFPWFLLQNSSKFGDREACLAPSLT